MFAFVQVDSKGNTLAASPSGHKLSQTISNNTTGLHAEGTLLASMSPTERSKTIWKRISPGMLPDTSSTPMSTSQEAFAYEPQLLERPDFTHHLKKTDFAEYTEVALRHMHHIQAAAKK